MKNIWIDGIMGEIGDALGMPVRFMERRKVKESLVEGMKEYGTYHLPPGTWSDDSRIMILTITRSMTKNFCKGRLLEVWRKNFCHGILLGML